MKKIIFKSALALLLVCSGANANAQFLMDMVDTTKFMGKDMLNLYNRMNGFRISGYIQAQYQIADTAGAKSFEGGDFSAYSNNRFMMRRGRIRMDYLKFNSKREISTQAVFQFDGTERGFFIRDMWGRVFDNKWHLFSGTAGIFARPFGYETNLGSADRESPERGRMNQTLMKVERDLGAMVSFEPRGRKDFLQYVKYDIGLFNGQGLNASTEFDSKKDLITRLALKPYPLTKKLFLSAGASYLHGGVLQNSKFNAEMSTINNVKMYAFDSVAVKGTFAKRQYLGGDIQLKLKHKWGATELRGEIITGQQSAYSSTSETPGAITADSTSGNALYTRNFTGVYAYFLQNIVNTHHQLVVKFDFYDPNTKVSGAEIGAIGSNLKASDIKYTTIGVGYNHYFGDNLRLLIYYAIVKNEVTNLTGYIKDLKDNIFTTRLQFRF